jgi:hypothetical protein
VTSDDFEAITSLEVVKIGRVKIMLTYLGFEISCSHGRHGLATRLISYVEADQARYPIEIFQHAIHLVQTAKWQS